MWRSRCGGAACGEAAGTWSAPREGWNPVPCVGDGGGLDRARAGRPWSVRDRGGALEQGRALDRGRPRQKLSTTHSVQPGLGAGLSRSPRSGVGFAGAKEREAGDVTRTTRFSWQRKREAHIKPEPQGHAGKGSTLRCRVGWDRRSTACQWAPRRGGDLTWSDRHVEDATSEAEQKPRVRLLKQQPDVQGKKFL